jgi:hypothetical protein
MVVFLFVFLAQLDANDVYQGMSQAQKQRVFLVYQQELRARQDFDEAVKWTSKQTNDLPEGAIRLVVLELRRKAKIEEDEKARQREKEKKNAPQTGARRTTGAATRTPRTSSNRPPRPNQSQAASPKKSQSGDGVHEVGSREEIEYKQERYTPFGFRSQCVLVLPQDFYRAKDGVPVAVDGRVKTTMKGATVVALTSTETGEEKTPIVLVHSRSVKAVESLRKGDLVRAYGWTVRKEDFKPVEGEPDVTADGRLFFAMDVGVEAQAPPGLTLAPKVVERESAGGDRPIWDVEVAVKNDGDWTLDNVIIEANLIAYGPKPLKADDTALFIVERLAPGESRTLRATKESWIEPKKEAKDRVSSRFANRYADDFYDDEEEEKGPKVHVVARALSGKPTADCPPGDAAARRAASAWTPRPIRGGFR